VPSGGSEVLPDINISVDGNQLATYPSVQDLNITITNANIESAALVGGDVEIEVDLPDEFIFVVDTTKNGVTSNNEFLLPVHTVSANNFNIKTSEQQLFNVTAGVTLTWSEPGIYKVEITGVFGGIRFAGSGDKDKLVSIVKWGIYNKPLITASGDFDGCNITEIPDDVDFLNHLVQKVNMFRNCNLTTVPETLTLDSMINGQTFLGGNNLTSLPSGMTLPNLTSGNAMFFGNNLTSLPVGMTLSNLTNGGGMFQGCTINTARYSQLLIDLSNLNSNNNVVFHGGNSQYNAAGEIARNELVSRGWTITDGGLE
jgi:hypothetical protein